LKKSRKGEKEMAPKRSDLVNDLIGPTSDDTKVSESRINVDDIINKICRLFKQAHNNGQLGMQAIQQVRAELKLLPEEDREKILKELDKKNSLPETTSFEANCYTGVTKHFSQIT